jgi:branched-chain amino acid transport system substrate-binding protein
MLRVLVVAFLAAVSAANPASAQDGTIPVKVGVLTDMSGFFADAAGPGAVTAARLAIEDAAARYPELKVSLLSADHQNKADVGSAIARQWIDQEHVAAIVDLTNSAVGLAVQQLGAAKNTITMSTAGTSALTEKLCSKTGVQWTMDSYTYSKAVTKAVLAQGGKSWFFITVDYAGGHALESAMGSFVKEAGGTVLGAARHPANSRDFASYLISAQASGAKVVGLANAGADAIETIKQAHEFGLVAGGQILAAPTFFITDVHSLGLQTSQGVRFASPFYWDMNDGARAWSKRFMAKMGKMPTHLQAGDYTFLMHYFAAVHAARTTDAAAVMAKMREMPIHDFMTKAGTLRANGSVVRERMLLQVKAPSETQGPWDYLKMVHAMTAEEAAPKPLRETGCGLVGS